MSTSCTDPRGSILSPENPLKWAFTGSSFSFPMPISSNVDAKMMSAEIPLSIRTMWIVDCFIGHDDPYHQRVIMGVLATFQVSIREGYGGIQSREFGHSLHL